MPRRDPRVNEHKRRSSQPAGKHESSRVVGQIPQSELLEEADGHAHQSSVKPSVASHVPALSSAGHTPPGLTAPLQWALSRRITRLRFLAAVSMPWPGSHLMLNVRYQVQTKHCTQNRQRTRACESRQDGRTGERGQRDDAVTEAKKKDILDVERA